MDTETTGLPLFGKPSEDPGQPHLVQLAVAVIDPADWSEQFAQSWIIKPDGWAISPELVAIHGITTERAETEGEPLVDVIREFWKIAGRCDLGVAYNGSFDRKILRIASLRADMEREEIEAAEASLPMVDPCRIATPIVNLPPTEKMLKAGFKKAKTAKLTEAYRHFFGEDFDGAHDAMNDVRATVQVLRRLVELGKVPALEARRAAA